MGSVTRRTEVPGPISAAEELWYDLRRRVAFLDGFGHVVRGEGTWPEAGARLLWDAPPGGRGRVAERVEAFVAREGQTVAFEDERLHGTQVTSFAATAGGGVEVTVRLAWELKDGHVLKDWLVVRRALGESLRRTLVRFRIERLADLDDERALRP